MFQDILSAADLANGAGDLADVKAAWMDIQNARIDLCDKASRPAARRNPETFKMLKAHREILAAKSLECQAAYRARGGK